MAQNYKVYFANRPVFFISAANAVIPTAVDVSAFNSQGKHDASLIENAINFGAKSVYVLCDDVDRTWELFVAHFEFVQAAGGVVINPDLKVLFIYRMDKWDLPKGKVEDGEGISEGALREVEEECSISDLNLKDHLCTTWHTYIQKGVPILKSTQWFLMNYVGDQKPQPQLIEGITEVRWLAEEDWDVVRKNTYSSVIDVLEAYKASRI